VRWFSNRWREAGGRIRSYRRKTGTTPKACKLLVWQHDIAWRTPSKGTGAYVQTVTLPISVVKAIAQHEEYHVWVAERYDWIEAHGSQQLKNDLGFELTRIERDYIQERAALELPDFVPDFDGQAHYRDPDYKPAPNILREVDRLAKRGYCVDTYELLDPPWPLDSDERFLRCECIVIHNYLRGRGVLLAEYVVAQ
jgi:hypothetical protein